ncbi:MAG: helix-turn-helix domain-containing protein [Acidobacteriota bacterium]
MPMKREFKYDHCKNCGGSYLRKPKSRLFCKPACRHQHNNRKRVNLIESQMMTVGQAATISGKTYEQVRGMIRRGEIRARRFFGRILIYRADVEARILIKGGIDVAQDLWNQ